MKSIKTVGLFSNIMLSTILIFIFFGSILRNANSVYFSASGDGLKSTYGSIYHLNYDTTYLRTSYMNYPFGESVFYTGGQPVIVNTFKFFKNIGIDFSGYLLGFLNTWLLFSIVIGAMFIYLILRELKLPVFYSIVVSNIIAFMSPQMDRFGGHFNLAYLYFIPLMIYLLFIFYRKRKLYISIVLGLVALWSLVTHVYFFGFYGILVLCFWIGVFLYDKKSFGKPWFIIVNVVIQLIIPYIIFKVLLSLSGDVSDRTMYPWGFFSFLAYPQGIFYPINKFYGRFIYVKQVPWEGIAYIGLVSVIGFLIILYYSIKKPLKLRSWSFLQITDNHYLNILFWTSLIALLFSFGLPFTLGLQKLYNYMGELRQIRGPGRFAWIFFYSINITTFYLLWHYYKRSRKLVAFIILLFALSWATFDSYLNVKSVPKYINNKIESLNDKNNVTEQNKWYHEIDFSKYQAIIPLPYFHIGSENYWIDGSAEIKKIAFIASIKTGLPLTAVMMGRTSMNQTRMSLQLVMEPYNNCEILNYVSSEKPFLVIFAKEGNLTLPERDIKNRAKLLTSNDKVEIRTITKDELNGIIIENKEKLRNEINSGLLFKYKDFLSNDSIPNYVYCGFGDETPGDTKLGEKCYVGNIKKDNLIIDSELENVDTSQAYIVSLWVENMDKDIYPRTVLTLEQFNQAGDRYYSERFDIWRRIKILDSNGWGLVEFNIKLKNPTDRVKISMKNNLLTSGQLKVDELLIRQTQENLYLTMNNLIFKNNRFYILSY